MHFRQFFAKMLHFSSITISGIDFFDKVCYNRQVGVFRQQIHAQGGMKVEEELLKQELKREYEKWTKICECGLESVVNIINNLKTENEMSDERTYYHRIDYRIKSWESVCGKCEKKGIEPTVENIKSNILDVAGIRIITWFEDDIARVYDALSHHPSIIEAREPRDYINNPKENGYRSFHFNINYSLYFKSKTISVPIEIQIRDAAMDLWAAMEHNIKYKNPCPSKDAPETFKELAKILADFDKEAIRLRDQSPEMF